MRKLLLISFLFAIMPSALPAQTQKTILPDKVEIATPDLPEPVKNIITTEYEEWKLMGAYVYSASPEYYELTLKKGENEKKIIVDAKGNKIHDK